MTNTCLWCGFETINSFGCTMRSDGRDCYRSTEISSSAGGIGATIATPYPPPAGWVPPMQKELARRVQALMSAPLPTIPLPMIPFPVTITPQPAKPLIPETKRFDPFAPIGLKESHAKPKDPKLPCCGWCGEVLGMLYSNRTGIKRGCSVHGLEVPVVGEFAGAKRHP